VNVTDVPAQTGFAPAAMVTLTGRLEFTVIVTVFDVAGLPVAQVALDVSTQVTASLFKGIYDNVGLLVPELVPLTFHWYDGVVPPLTGVAVNVTDVPAQTGLAPAAIVTLTGSEVLTIIVTEFEVAGLPVAQGSLEVSTQVTTSLFNGM